MKTSSPITAATAAVLAFCLVLPSPVLALRVSEPQEDPNRRAGLEQMLAGLEEIQVYRGNALIDTYHGAIPKNAFGQLDGVTIKGLKLGAKGALYVGGRVWIRLERYSNAPAEADVEQGYVAGLRVLSETGAVLETFPFARIERRDGTLVDTSFRQFPSDYPAQLGPITIKGLRLDNDGGLSLGRRLWLTLENYPGYSVEADAEQGFVTEVRVLAKDGNVVKVASFARIERRDGTLVDTFYSPRSPLRLAQLGQVTLKGLRLDPDGKLYLGKDDWLVLAEFPDAPLEVDVDRGNVIEARVLAEDRSIRGTFPLSQIELRKGDRIKRSYEPTQTRHLTQQDRGTIKGFRLDTGGNLNFGGRTWVKLQNYPGALVEVDLEQSLITEVRVLNDSGVVQETFPFARVENLDGMLVGTFYRGIQPDHLVQFGQVIIKGLRLDASGQLSLGGRSLIKLKKYPNTPVEVEAERGFVTRVRVLSQKGTLLESFPFVRIEQRSGELVDTFYGQLRSQRLIQLDQVTLKGLRLDPGGQLTLARRFWLRSGEDAGAPVEIDIEQGKVTAVRVLNEVGNIIKTLRLVRIERADGTLIDTFYGKLFPRRLAQLDQATIKGFRLDVRGHLSLGGRSSWGTFSRFPNALVEVNVVQGKITTVRILTEDGRVSGTFSFVRIERQDGTLAGTFYDRFSPPQLARLDQVTIKGIKLDAVGNLHLGGRNWIVFRRHPGAEVEAYVERGQVAWVKIVKDQRGASVNSRTGFGFGKARRKLLPKELAFRAKLIEEFQRVGIPNARASAAAETLVRLYNGSLALLCVDSLLTAAEVRAITELDLRSLDVDGRVLGRKLLALMKDYETRLHSFYKDPAQGQSFIDQLLAKHLFPWATIERLRRTYRLGQDLSLIEQALGHPDVEAWIRRIRETREARGTFDATKHLHRYDPRHKPPYAENNQALIGELRVHTRVLEQLLRRPSSPSCPCRVTVVVPQEVVIRVEPRGMFDLRRSQQALLTVQNATTVWEVQAYHPEEQLVTLRPLRREDIAEIRANQKGSFQPTLYDIPLKQQQELLQRLLTELDRSNGRTTENRVFDHFFGLLHLAPSDPQVQPVAQFLNGAIPYRRISEFESQGDQSQEMAVQLAMNPTQILFIEGPAGTGKTTVIAEVLRQAVSRGQKILLISQMHQAVDNALAAVMDDPQMPVLRLGNDPANFRYGTERIWPGNSQTGVRQEVVSKFEQRLHRAGTGLVLASTNSGIGTDWFFARHLKDTPQLRGGFDLLIMDESSRETLPGALAPLSFLKPTGKMIFVGDAKQLPPFGLTEEDRQYLQNSRVPEEAIVAHRRSVFEWLLANGQGDRVMLSTNYRSHPLITGLISTLFYEGDVHRRGWEDFDAETLSLRVIDLAAESNVYYEKRTSDGSYVNEQATAQVLQLVRLYQTRGIPLDQITVITPYKAQVELLGQRLQKEFRREERLPVVTTIDSYQGGENRAIIFDFVRSNPRRQIGFVKDLRRLNVGISRAQENLAIIWDSRTFTGEPSPSESAEDRTARTLFQQLSDYCENEVQAFFPEPVTVDEANGGPSAGLEEARVETEPVGIIAAGLEDVRGLPLGLALSRMKDGSGRFLPVVYIARSAKQAAGLEELGVEKSSVFILGPDLSLKAALTAAENRLRRTTGVHRTIRLGVDRKIPGILEWLVQNFPGIELSPQMAGGLEEWVEGATKLLEAA